MKALLSIVIGIASYAAAVFFFLDGQIGPGCVLVVIAGWYLIWVIPAAFE